MRNKDAVLSKPKGAPKDKLAHYRVAPFYYFQVISHPETMQIQPVFPIKLWLFEPTQLRPCNGESCNVLPPQLSVNISPESPCSAVSACLLRMIRFLVLRLSKTDQLSISASYSSRRRGSQMVSVSDPSSYSRSRQRWLWVQFPWMALAGGGVGSVSVAAATTAAARGAGGYTTRGSLGRGDTKRGQQDKSRRQGKHNPLGVCGRSEVLILVQPPSTLTDVRRLIVSLASLRISVIMAYQILECKADRSVRGAIGARKRRSSEVSFEG